MAIVKSIDNSIKSGGAVSKAIDYITNPDKTSLVTFENCGGNTNEITADFENMRVAFNQNQGRLAHHYVQSFSPDDNVTAEQAHEIALEFIRKVAPDYQVIVATHADTEKIHNHFIINSCNTKTGKKWHDNKTTLNMMRAESDKLCVKNNLSVIKYERFEIRAVDQTTYQLSMQGKSWKSQLVNDLDAARSACRSKLDFIDFLNKRGYDVRYTDSHITFKPKSQAKGIRADTLARQFGEKYTKTNLEKSMGVAAIHSPKNVVHHNRKITGNIRYRELTQLPGENFKCKINADKLLLLQSSAFFYSAKILANGEALVTVKSTDRERLAKTLGIELTALPMSAEAVLPNKKASEKIESENQRNFRINAELKSQSAASGDKLCYKVITPEQLGRVKLTDAKIAYFESKKESSKFNIVYLESDAAKVNYAVFNEIKGLKK